MKRILLAVVCIFLVFGIVGFIPAESSTPKQEEHGDITVIGENYLIENFNRPIKGNITVKDGGFLTVKNSTLEFVQANDPKYQYHIFVESGSKLVLKNTFIYVTTEDIYRPYLKFSFVVTDSECVIENSTLAFPGWINIINSNLTIRNSTITNINPAGTGVTIDENDDCPIMIFDSSNIVMANSRVEHYYEASLPEQEFVSQPSNFTVTPFNTSTVPFLPSDITNVTNRLTAAMLEVSYKGEENYTGNSYVEWSTGGSYQSTGIQPTNITATKTYDLFLQEVGSVADLENLSVKFVNNDPGGENSSVNFTSMRVVFAYENDITLINSTLHAFDTYLDVDSRPADADPVTGGIQETQADTCWEDASSNHNILRITENSNAYLYNVTIDLSETNNQIPPEGDPPFLADETSNIFVHRWLHIKTIDGGLSSLPSANIKITRYHTPDEIPPPLQPVLDYLGRSSENYNITDENGEAIIPLCSDVINVIEWPVFVYKGNYTVNISYPECLSISKNIGLARFPKITEEDNNPSETAKFSELIPDMSVSMSVFPLSPMKDEKVEINATIYNNGTTNAWNVPVLFYDNGGGFDKRSVNVTMNGYKSISVNWTAVSSTPSELHNLSVVVNPLDAMDVIPEINYENNEKHKFVTVYSRPDLFVESILFSSPFAVEDDEVTISTSIFNSGETDANAVIKFYKNDVLFNSSDIFVAANDTLPVNTFFNTAGEGGNVSITVKITGSIPEESDVLNNEKSETIFVYVKHEMVLDYDKHIDYNFTWKGYIIVKDNGSLTLSNATLIMEKNTEKQCEIIVLNNGKLIVQNSIITSGANLKIYLYGNSILTVINSTMILDVVGSGESEISIQNSVINGTVDVGCKMFSVAEFNLNGDLKLNATTANIENSFINATDINIEASVLWANNTNLTSPLTFSMGNAYLVNVTVPTITSIDAAVYRSWWLTVDVTDSAGSVLPNATVNVYSTQTEPFDLVNSSLTDENGTAVIALPTDTNYLVKIVYENCTSQIYEYIKNNTKIAAVLPKVIVKPSSFLITIDAIPEAKVGETTNISGTIKYNLKNILIENVTVTLTVNGIPYNVEVESSGDYSVEITAPNKGGTYTVKITVVDNAYNLSSAEKETQLTVEGKPVPPPDYTSMIIGIVVAIVIIVIVGVICFIKREKIKPYLLILKAKIKKEEFIECGECGKKIPETFKKCPYCDAEFEEELVKCSECSAFIPASADKCPKCGALFEE